MKKLIIICIYILSTSVFSQSTIKTVLDNYNDGAVPYIKVEALKKNINKATAPINKDNIGVACGSFHFSILS